MSDYLSNVAAKSLNLIEPIHPRLASRFEPLPTLDGLTTRLPLEAEPVEEPPKPASIVVETAPLSVSAPVSPVSGPPTPAPRQPLAAPMTVVPPTPDRDEAGLTASPQVPAVLPPPPGQPAPRHLSAAPMTVVPPTPDRDEAGLTASPQVPAVLPPPPGQPAPRHLPTAPMTVVPPTPDRNLVDQPRQSVLNSITRDVVPPSARSSPRPSSPSGNEGRQQESPTSLPVQGAPPATPAIGVAPSSVIPPMPATVRARSSVTPHVESVTPATPATPTVAPPVSQSAPTIRVTIGRIDVRAIVPPAPPAPRSRPSRPGPTLSLEDYLQQRREGRR